LAHKRPATFFRSLGAVLGYTPTPGSLVGRRNQNNYRFDRDTTSEICEWIACNLQVSWLEDPRPMPAIEQSLIRRYAPLFNIAHNPRALEAISDARRRCREIARSA
jgi:hypothetical protein